MFILFFIVSTQEKSDITTLEKSATSIPSICEGKEMYDSYSFNIKMKQGEIICVQSKGSIFVNGNNIKITGYTNGVEQMAGVGDFAFLGDNSQDDYIFTLESFEYQTIGMIAKWRISNDLTVYITTKSTTDAVCIIRQSEPINKKYSGGFIALGERQGTELSILTYPDSDAEIFPLSGNNQYVENSKNATFKGCDFGVFVKSEADKVYDDCKVKLSSNNNSNWKNTIEGFIKLEKNHVYSRDDLSSTVTKVDLYFWIVLGCLLGLSLIEIILYFVLRKYCKRKREDISFEEDKIVKTKINNPIDINKDPNAKFINANAF